MMMMMKKNAGVLIASSHVAYEKLDLCGARQVDSSESREKNWLYSPERSMPAEAS